jgi:hypothetical protein
VPGGDDTIPEATVNDVGTPDYVALARSAAGARYSDIVEIVALSRAVPARDDPLEMERESR